MFDEQEFQSINDAYTIGVLKRKVARLLRGHPFKEDGLEAVLKEVEHDTVKSPGDPMRFPSTSQSIASRYWVLLARTVVKSFELAMQGNALSVAMCVNLVSNEIPQAH